ncbi:hypothetical protein M409DRAFT_16038 [Zasmidium cellare ATCC 36951]|uniref:Uncharacterized protein n=1 Tax=Zasmidium cellare ATCC 36951 TaxID=1080233 RepID=A0A6A6D3Y9_ZASCE|nr:uncharacterized protein M409DRAFT_16038 [Zasmidium cellare ATCC 36951]KAF2173765.1 hypothetical protein M409DRAFT_16038 [Zasmidium cellare ATCC 36951]
MEKRKAPPPQDEPQGQLESKRLKGGIDSDDDMDNTKQLVPMISRAETAAVQHQFEHDSATADDDSGDEEFVDAPEEVSDDLDIPPPPRAQDDVINVSNDEEDEEEEDDDDMDDTKSTSSDLFDATFSHLKDQKEEEDAADDDGDDGDNDSKQDSGIESSPNSHTQGCEETRRRISTPPLPTPDLIVTGATTITKKPSPTKSDPNAKKEEGRIRVGPDVDRDLSEGLRSHFRFHERVANLIPRLNAPDFDWSRRYWIAVLSHLKRAKNATSEKDFVWMKGNRLSTGKTILHKYSDSMFPDPERTVLMLGHERLGMGDTMEECDFFGDRLVVLRAVEEGVGELKEKSLVAGLVKEVPEVVALDDD